MSDVFEQIELTWDGRAYRIPPNRVMGAIARIEDAITLPELARAAQRGAAPLAKIAQAYAGVLRYAGATITDEEMYVGLFPDEDKQLAAATAVQALLMMMVPPASRADGDARPPQRMRRAAASSSQKPTRQPDSGD